MIHRCTAALHYTAGIIQQRPTDQRCAATRVIVGDVLIITYGRTFYRSHMQGWISKKRAKKWDEMGWWDVNNRVMGWWGVMGCVVAKN